MFVCRDQVLRSIGYRSLPIEGVPFDEKTGVIPNVAGRISPGGCGCGGVRKLIHSMWSLDSTGSVGCCKRKCSAHMVSEMALDKRHSRFNAYPEMCFTCVGSSQMKL